MQLIKRFWNDRSAATAVEYGILLGTLCLVIVASISNAMEAVQWLFADNESRIVQAFKPK